MARAAFMLNARTMRAARHALAVIAVAAGYYLAGVVGTVLSVPPSGFAIIWPATAFLVAVLLIAPPRLGWLYLAGVIPAHFHLVMNFQHADVPLVVMVSQVTGNIGLAVATSLVVRGPDGAPPRFDNFRTVLRFAV